MAGEGGGSGGGRAPAGTVALGPGGEFDLIRRFLAGTRHLPPEVRVGPGDDAAVLEGGWAVACDASVEGVHFRRAWLSNEEIGHRAVAAALSDLAAVAARPVGVLVALLCGDHAGAEAVMRGARAAAEAHGAVLLGGDTVRSGGPLALDVTVLGVAPRPLLRSGARPGDTVWVSGPLGAAAAAVAAWEEGGTPAPPLRRAFVEPVPRIEMARELARREGVGALIDLSDGLAGDAAHVAAASGVRVILDGARIPVSPAALELNQERARHWALHGGEDYELCFTWRGDAHEAPPAVGGCAPVQVGTVEAGSGVWLNEGGVLQPLSATGYDHFGGAG